MGLHSVAVLLMDHEVVGNQRRESTGGVPCEVESQCLRRRTVRLDTDREVCR